jgi:cbb3-type cytochrome oxidase subunit 3
MRYDIPWIVVILIGLGLFVSGDTWSYGWIAFAGIMVMFAGFIGIALCRYRQNKKEEVGDAAETKENTQARDSSTEDE